jgi:hypothetical protein
LIITDSLEENSHLVGEQYGDPKLVRESEKHPEETGQMHLAGAQFTSSRIICSVQRGRTVNLQNILQR